MAGQPNDCFRSCERIKVEKESEGNEKIIKIVLERFDSALGWYSAGAMKIPLHQLPLLQQSICELSAQECTLCAETQCQRKILLFPTVSTPREVPVEQSV